MVAPTTEAAQEMQAEVLARPGYDSDVAALQSASGALDLLSIDPETRVSEILDQITGIRGLWENAAAADDPTVAEFAKRFRNMAADSYAMGRGDAKGPVRPTGSGVPLWQYFLKRLDGPK